MPRSHLTKSLFWKNNVFLLLAFLLSTFVSAQTTYPDRPIKLIVPYPPGGQQTCLLGHLPLVCLKGWGSRY